jgi:hypothetical protein
MPVKHDIATISATSVRKISPEKVPRESTAQARNVLPISGRAASV